MGSISFVRRPVLRHVAALALVSGASFALAGCGDVGSSLGFGKRSPDEFAVTAHRPLSLPPDFALRPPGETGQPSDAREQARVAVFRAPSSGVSDGTRSGGELAILDRMQVDRADPQIRMRITEEAIEDIERKASSRGGFLGL